MITTTTILLEMVCWSYRLQYDQDAVLFFVGTQANDTIHIVRITEVEVRVGSDQWSSWNTEINIRENTYQTLAHTLLSICNLLSNMLKSVNQARLGSIRKKWDSTRLPFEHYSAWTSKPISMILALNLILLVFERPLNLFFDKIIPTFYTKSTVITGPLRGLNFEFQHQVAQEETFSILGTQLFPLSLWTLPGHNPWNDFYSCYVEIAIEMWLFAPWTTNLESTSILA